MQKYSIEFIEEAKEDLLGLNKKLRKMILDKLEILQEFPDFGEPLHNDLKGYRKLKVSKYRVVYSVEEDRLVVLVLAAGIRKDEYVYKMVKKRINNCGLVIS